MNSVLQVSVNVSEDIPEGYRLAEFSAQDVDNDGHGKISYVIDGESDPEHQFSINEHGVVTLQVEQ